MRLAYTSGPYRADTIRGVIDNIRAAEEVAIQLWKMGYAVICPHTNTQLFDGAFDEGKMSTVGDKEDAHWEGGSVQFIKGDLVMLDRMLPGTDIVVMLKNWEKSKGANIERDHAIRHGLLIVDWDYVGDKYIIERLAETDNGRYTVR